MLNKRYFSIYVLSILNSVDERVVFYPWLGSPGRILVTIRGVSILIYISDLDSVYYLDLDFHIFLDIEIWGNYLQVLELPTK